MMAKRIAKTGIDISARMFYAALVCVSTEETRYYLNGVHVEPHPEKGAVLVATDGHRMIVLHDEAGYAGRKAIIPADKELVAALARATKPADADARLLIDKDRIVSVEAASYRAAKNTLIDGTYVDWARAIRPALRIFRRKERGWASYNPSLLAAFGEVSVRLGIAGHWPSLRLCSNEATEGAVVLFPRTKSAFGVLMPMRDEVMNAAPNFMKPILATLPKEKRPALAPKSRAKAKPRRRAA